MYLLTQSYSFHIGSSQAVACDVPPLSIKVLCPTCQKSLVTWKLKKIIDQTAPAPAIFWEKSITEITAGAWSVHVIYIIPSEVATEASSLAVLSVMKPRLNKETKQNYFQPQSTAVLSCEPPKLTSNR